MQILTKELEAVGSSLNKRPPQVKNGHHLHVSLYMLLTINPIEQKKKKQSDASFLTISL